MPYFVTNTLLFLVFWELTRFGALDQGASFSWGRLLHSFLYPQESANITYWFLPTIFIIQLTARMALGVVRHEWVLVVMTVLSLPLYLLDWHDINWLRPYTLLDWTGAAAYFFWWGVGYFFCKYQSRMVHILRLKSGWTCLSLLVVLVGSGIVWPQVQWIRAVLGILLCISAAYIYVKRDWRFVDHLAGYSFSIYLLHWFVSLVFSRMTKEMPWWATMPLYVVCGVYIPYYTARLVQRLPHAPRLLKLLVGVRG